MDHQLPDADPVCTMLTNRAVWFGNTIVMIPVAPVPLARLEGKIVFETLLRRFPELEPGADPFDVTWSRNPLLRGVAELPVRLGPDRG